MMAREATVCAAIAPKRKKVKKKKARAPSFCPNTSNSWSFSRNFSGKLRATVILLGLLRLPVLGIESSSSENVGGVVLAPPLLYYSISTAISGGYGLGTRR
jgi:hypothetical protein